MTVATATAPTMEPEAAESGLRASLSMADLKRAATCIGGALVFAVMTGPDGSNQLPLSGLKHSLTPPHVTGFLVFGVVLAVVTFLWRHAKDGSWVGYRRTTTALRSSLRRGYASVLASTVSRRILQALVLAALLFVSLFIADFLGPYRPDKASFAQLAHTLTYRMTYAYLFFGLALGLATCVRIEREAAGSVPKDRSTAERVVVALGAIVGAVTVALAIAPGLPETFSWSMLIPGTSVSIWSKWVTYACLAAGLAFAAKSWRWKPARLAQARPAGQRFAGSTTLTFYLLGLFLAIEAPQYFSGFWQSQLITQIGIYVLLAIGLNVVVGFAGLLDLGYVGFYAVGAYATAYFTGSLPVQPPIILNPFYIIPIAIILAMGAGILLGLPTLRLRGDYLAIVTLGFGEIIYVVLNNWTSITGGAQGSTLVPPFSINLLGIHYTWDPPVQPLPAYYLLLAFTVIVLVLFTNANHSRVGRRWAAIREDEVAAESIGISGLKYKVLAFAIGASTAGFAGVFIATAAPPVQPSGFQLQQSILVLVFVIFGGMGSMAGVILGASLLSWLVAFFTFHSYLGFQEQDNFMYIGAVLILMMIFRPQGILPSRRRTRELHLAEEGIGSADALGTSFEGPLSHEFATEVDGGFPE